MSPHCPTGAGAPGTRILVTDEVRAQTQVWGPRDVTGSRLAAFPGTSDAWDGATAARSAFGSHWPTPVHVRTWAVPTQLKLP